MENYCFGLLIVWFPILFVFCMGLVVGSAFYLYEI